MGFLACHQGSRYELVITRRALKYTSCTFLDTLQTIYNYFGSKTKIALMQRSLTLSSLRLWGYAEDCG